MSDTINVEVNDEEQEGKIVRLLSYGAMVTIGNKTGLLHNNKLPNRMKANYIFNIGDLIKVKIEDTKKDGKLSLKLAEGFKIEPKQQPEKPKRIRKKKSDKPYVFNPKIAWNTKTVLLNGPGDAKLDKTFEDKLKFFLKESDEKRLDIKKSIEAKRG